MLANKFTCILLLLLSFQVKGMSPELCLDSVNIHDAKLNLFLSSGKAVTLKLRYHNGSMQAKYKGCSFIVKYDTIYNNSYVDTLLNEMESLRKNSYKDPMFESIGYILYDSDHLYFMNLFENYIDKKNILNIQKYKFSNLCFNQDKKVFYITMIGVTYN